MATYPNASIPFHAYMVLPEARSCAGGYSYLSSLPSKTKEIPLNSDIHNKCNMIRNTMGSVVDAEVGGLYVNCQCGQEFRTALQEKEHLQPPTIVITDSSTAEGIINSCAKQRRT
eukprot:14404553-Ditylum_brightwellii.AAC.1